MSSVFHERLNKIMKDKCLTPGTVAIRTGMSDRQIRNYQKGNSQPGWYSLKVLAKALDVSVDYLIGAEDET